MLKHASSTANIFPCQRDLTDLNRVLLAVEGKAEATTTEKCVWEMQMGRRRRKTVCGKKKPLAVVCLTCTHTHTHTHTQSQREACLIGEEGRKGFSLLSSQFMEECCGYERNKTAIVIGVMAPPRFVALKVSGAKCRERKKERLEWKGKHTPRASNDFLSSFNISEFLKQRGEA